AIEVSDRESLVVEARQGVLEEALDQPHLPIPGQQSQALAELLVGGVSQRAAMDVGMEPAVVLGILRNRLGKAFEGIESVDRGPKSPAAEQVRHPEQRGTAIGPALDDGSPGIG